MPKRQVSKGAFSPWSFQGEGLRGEGNRNPSPLMPSLFYFLGTKKVMKKDLYTIFCLRRIVCFSREHQGAPLPIEILFAENRMFFAAGASPRPTIIEMLFAKNCIFFAGG